MGGQEEGEKRHGDDGKALSRGKATPAWKERGVTKRGGLLLDVFWPQSMASRQSSHQPGFPSSHARCRT